MAMEDCLRKAMQMFQVSCYDCLLINVFKHRFYTKIFIKTCFIKSLLIKFFDLFFQNVFSLFWYKLWIRMLNLLLSGQLSFHYARTLFCFKLIIWLFKYLYHVLFIIHDTLYKDFKWVTLWFKVFQVKKLMMLILFHFSMSFVSKVVPEVNDFGWNHDTFRDE